MAVEVITASIFYPRLLSVSLFLSLLTSFAEWKPGDGKTASSHFEDKLQQLTAPEQCSFPLFSFLCHFPRILHIFTFIYTGLIV